MWYKKIYKKKWKLACFKWPYGIFGNDYRVATLSVSYLSVKGIIIQSLKSIEHSRGRRLNVPFPSTLCRLSIGS